MLMDDLYVALQLTAVGMSVVFSGLVLLVFVLILFQRLDKWITQQRSAPSTDGAGAPEPLVTSEPTALREGVRPETIVVIAAAISVALSRRVQVKRVRYLGVSSENAWARQGRVTIMGSHKTKR